MNTLHIHANDTAIKLFNYSPRVHTTFAIEKMNTQKKYFKCQTINLRYTLARIYNGGSAYEKKSQQIIDENHRKSEYYSLLLFFSVITKSIGNLSKIMIEARLARCDILTRFRLKNKSQHIVSR